MAPIVSVGTHVLLTAAVCDRVDHHQGISRKLDGIGMTAKFLQETHRLGQTSGAGSLGPNSNTTAVVIDWIGCLSFHPAHVYVYTPDRATFDAAAYAAWSPNDFRYALYHAFFREHGQVQRVMIMDGRDTAIRRNPLPLMRPRTLYIGKNSDSCVRSQKHGPEWCHGFLSQCDRGFLNAGMVGGDAAVVVSIIDSVVAFLRTCNGNPACKGGNKIVSHNLNMIAVNCVVYSALHNTTAATLDVVNGPPLKDSADAWLAHGGQFALTAAQIGRLTRVMQADLRLVAAATRGGTGNASAPRIGHGSAGTKIASDQANRLYDPVPHAAAEAEERRRNTIVAATMAAALIVGTVGGALYHRAILSSDRMRRLMRRTVRALLPESFMCTPAGRCRW